MISRTNVAHREYARAYRPRHKFDNITTDISPGAY